MVRLFVCFVIPSSYIVDNNYCDIARFSSSPQGEHKKISLVIVLIFVRINGINF